MKENKKMEYNTGNIEKYNTKNPLKRFMLDKFFLKLLQIFSMLIDEEPKTKTVLDMGCGEGVVSNFLYDNFNNLNIRAVDYFEEAIQKAKENNDRNIIFETGDITSLKYKDSSFDVVVSTEVLEHIKFPSVALKELYRVSKKHIILSVPNEPFFCFGNLISGKNIKRLGNPIDHINHWTYLGFKGFVKKNLPQTISIKQYNLFVWTLVVITKNDK
ncbi:MAG: class I SAM-dependent methyltransferase [Alphaproteobacteria bacterium]|nr:class I SAM-dependent methyltransferase [Alphaproteobacteria bacterium]